MGSDAGTNLKVVGAKRRKFFLFCLPIIVVPNELYTNFTIGENVRNLMKLFNEHGTLWNFTNFTFCLTLCRHCNAGLAAPNMFCTSCLIKTVHSGRGRAHANLRFVDRILSVGYAGDTVKWTTDNAVETDSQSDYFRL